MFTGIKKFKRNNFMEKISFDDLKGKICVITGGTNTLGNALALCLANSGLKIVVWI